jgi:CubicO group peptidase (beta-lactamase class C family)
VRALAVLFALAVSLSSTESDLDAIASSYFPAEEPGAAVLVVRGDEVLLRKGYGLADVELGVTVAPDMVFRIGSVTKQFTAAAILLLEERGKLSVKDDVRKHLPDYPTEGRTITIEHLLTHTSGIRSYTDMESFSEHIRDDLNVGDVIELFQDEPLAFEPGEKYAYNNSGYFLLGAIIEKVSGKTYEAFVRENIFEPLGMSQSYYGSDRAIVPRRAKGYDGRNGEFQNADYLSMTLPYAAGSLLSTVDDLSKWDRALDGTGFLSRASLDKWWVPFHLTNGSSTSYGYGWGISSYAGHSVVSHGGGINGFTCHLLRMPDEKLLVVVLTNRNDEKTNPTLVARKLAAAAIGKPIETAKTVPVPNDALDQLAGLYRVDARARYLVTRAEKGLVLRRYGDEHPEGGRTRDPGPNERLNRTPGSLIPASPTEFSLEDSLTRVRFGKDALVVEDWGREERATKIDEPFDDRSRVIAAIRILFDGMAGRDAQALRSVLDRDARLVQTSSQGGRPSTRETTAEEFVSRISSDDGPQLKETMRDMEVTVSGNLATVFGPYTFHEGDELSHCGENAFQLARTDVSWPGWKILSIAYTRRTAGCEGH